MFDKVGDHQLTSREKAVLSDCFTTGLMRGLAGGGLVGAGLYWLAKRYTFGKSRLVKIGLVASVIGGVYIGTYTAIPTCLKQFAKLEDSEVGDAARRIIISMSGQEKGDQQQEKKPEVEEYDWELDEQRRISESKKRR
ncbi:hypothetical protein ABK040_001007 [Willaertia magna]